MVRRLPYKRQNRPRTTTFAVANIPQKAIAPDFSIFEKSGVFHLKKPVCSALGELLCWKGGVDML